jgi:predicted MFS family arabinose efflux permease
VFTAVAVLGAGLAAWALREPATGNPEAPGAGLAPRLLGGQRLFGGLAVVVLVGLFYGVVEVLVPLRLDRLEASGALIGGTFLAAAAVQALAGPAVGRFSDRRGAWAAIRVSLVCAAVLAVLLPLPDASWLLIALVVVAGPAVGSLWVPGMALVSHAAAHSGLDQGYAFALVNLVWAAAQTAGTAGGARIADSGGDAVAYGALAVVFAAAFIVSVAARRRTPSPAAAGGPTRPSPGAAPGDPLRRTSTRAATGSARCERT